MEKKSKPRLTNFNAALWKWIPLTLQQRIDLLGNLVSLSLSLSPHTRVPNWTAQEVPQIAVVWFFQNIKD